MPNSTRSSAACGSFRPAEAGPAGHARIDWRPSAWLVWSMPVLGLLAGISLLWSDLPPWLAWPGAVLALACGIRLWRRERRRPDLGFVFRGGASPLVDGEPADGFALQWRGPLAFARWRDARGRARSCAWWPDTLPPPQRRELRLAASAVRDAGRTASMAP